ncbi:Fusaric acid resistance protein-like [Enhydrobacter aerosaccus]|uniref:Fusaric acid resistance protein-like n=1 Tax=Enhydrobacter aerosaccus TaxID=225324 RepID=A0A1T4LMM0_9HYPH|nr:FUSC family protein [Enhydrobacter aerosaccus]SJZ55876.1 Fusaric acid resistance protein-like [Enhydrobacter aerosaccus]
METPGWDARQGILTAASVVLAVAFAALLGIDGLWWAAISAWMVANPDFSALWRKAIMRLLGTAVGLALGYWLAIVMEGFPPYQALAVFVACGLGCYQRFASPYGYAWFYGCLTLMLIVTVSIIETDTLFIYAQSRFLEIACGVVASALVHAVLLPRRSTAPPPPPAAADGDKSGLFYAALVGGFSGVALMALWSLTGLPALSQAILSCMFVVDRDFGTGRVRARQRFIGCLLGAALGLAALLFELDSLPVYATVLFAGIFFFSRLHHGGGRQSYIGTQGGLAFIAALVTDGGPPNALLPVIDRVAGIFIGVAVMVTISYILVTLMGRPRSAPTTSGT